MTVQKGNKIKVLPLDIDDADEQNDGTDKHGNDDDNGDAGYR